MPSVESSCSTAAPDPQVADLSKIMSENMGEITITFKQTDDDDDKFRLQVCGSSK